MLDSDQEQGASNDCTAFVPFEYVGAFSKMISSDTELGDFD